MANLVVPGGGGDAVSLRLEDDPSEKSKYDEVSGEVSVLARFARTVRERPEEEEDGGFAAQMGAGATAALVNCFVYSCHNLVELGGGGGGGGSVVVSRDDFPTTK